MNIASLGPALFLVAGLILLTPVLLGGVFVIVVVANRAEPDASGRRPAVVYAFATSFVTLFVTLFATFGVVHSVSGLIGKRFSELPGRHPVGDAVARASVLSALIALAAGAALYLHLRAGQRLTADGHDTQTSVGRVRASYLSAVSFVCVLIVVVSTAVAAYQVFRAVAPSVFSPNGYAQSTAPAFRALLPAVYLAAAAALILRAHVVAMPAELRARLMPGRTSPAEPATGE
jgi:hypothetical protein